MSQIGSRARAIFERVFPERQIYHRSGGTVRYISLSPWKQALLAGGATMVAGWCVYATVNVAMRGHVMSSQTAEMQRMEQKYKRHLAEARAREAAALAQMDERSAALENLATEFERRHETLQELLRIAGGLTDAGPGDVVERDNARLLVQASIEEADMRRSRPAHEAGGGDPLARGRLDKLKVEQEEFLAFAEEAAVQKGEEARGILNLTGVSITRVLGQDVANASAASGVGGPLIEYSDAQADDFIPGADQMDPAFARRVAQVAARLREYRQLRNVVDAAPLAPPVGVDYRETSGFGLRYDPFTRRPAIHQGLDMAAYHNAPVVSASPGVIAFAGAKTGYGLVVEIDHGHGFMTRYGHLNEITVKKNDKVAIGQRVGSMGSTGRSTATHLHYEVHFRGKPYDPAGFLKAGRHVYQAG